MRCSESESDVPLKKLPYFNNDVTLHPSASSIFYALSDLCGLRGMRKEQIRCTYAWWGGAARQDCVLVQTGRVSADLPMSGYSVARLLLLFSFKYAGEVYPCALVWWCALTNATGRRDEDTGVWLVERGYRRGEPHLAVIHTDTIYRAAHLLPCFAKAQVL